MIIVQDMKLKEGIRQGIIAAKEHSSPVLVSEVQKIDSIDAMALFNAGKDLYAGKRFFWKDPTGQMMLTGLGICTKIETDEASDRFLHAEKEWKQIIEDAIVLDDLKTEGTGLIAFGGFSFDPLKGKTTLWEKYSNTLFHIPRFLLTAINGETFLSTNVMCLPEDQLSLIERVERERNHILSSLSNSFSFHQVSLMDQLEVNPEQWKETVRDLVEELKEKKLKKVVLARELRLLFNRPVSVEAVLDHLLAKQQDSYIFALESKGDCFLGASPERLVKKQGTNVFSACLAGSISRGATTEEDQRLGNILLMDKKNLVEHQFVVEMIRDAMDQVCKKVEIPKHATLMKMRDIQHLFTPVRGEVKEGSSLLHLVERLHPTPALGGLPKEEAVAKIREIEDLDRGFYAGPIGWMDSRGNGEFAVAIRSALIQESEASLFAGCGIVKDSEPESEYIETKIKFKPMLSALGGTK